MRAFDPELPWDGLKDRVRPILPRVRPYTLPQDEPVRLVLPPGILVSFGVDIGPAFVHVAPPLLERWGIDVEEVAETALANVRRAARGTRERVVREPVGDLPVAAFQSRQGWAGSLLLVADEIPPLLGDGPHLLIAPMRDLLVALPPDVDLDFAAWLSDEFSSLDPNGLALGGFRYEAGSVTPVAIEAAVEA